MNKYLLISLMAFTIFLAFYKLGAHPLQDWDESRNGINAFEMLQNKDWVNLYFRQNIDDWNLKPPLSIWMIATSFSIFGYNEFALRVPSALSIVIATFFLFKIINLYQSKKFAFFTCLLLISVKGWIGYHVGRTGDMDAILLAMILGGTFYFLKYFDFNSKQSAFYSAIFFGLAFWVKGFAMAVYFPSILLYAYFSKRGKQLFLNKTTYFAGLTFILFPFLWFWINSNYGVLFNERIGLGSNAFTSMFWYDIVERFGNPNFINPLDPPSKFFFFSYIDTRFNVWNYFLYAGLLTLIIFLIRKKISFQQLNYKIKSPLILISLCWATPLCLFQNFSVVQHHWYLAPALPFIAIITFYFIDWLIKIWSPFKYIFLLALLFTITRQFFQLNASPGKPQFIQNNWNQLTSAKRIIHLAPNIDQSITLYLYLSNQNQKFLSISNELNNELDSSDVILTKKSDLNSLSTFILFNKIAESKNGDFVILKKKDI